ncbi:MAG: Com family DNA-binding transcriptional regulator [Fluviibacter sp.]
METIRCTHCNKKLAEATYTQLSIKCPRCGTINQKALEPLHSDLIAQESPYALPRSKQRRQAAYSVDRRQTPTGQAPDSAIP